MGSHGARIEWRADGGFRSGGYGRGHQWRFDGGQTVLASSSPLVVPVPR